MTFRLPALGLALRGIWHRRVLSSMVLVVGVAGAAAAAMGAVYGEAGDTAVLRQALREAAPPGQELRLIDAGWPDSPTPDGVVRQRTTSLLAAADGSAFFHPPVVGIDLAGHLDPALGTPGQVRLVSRDGMCGHLVIVSGGCPATAGEVLVSAAAADELGWELGGTVLLTEFGHEQTTPAQTDAPARGTNPRPAGRGAGSTRFTPVRLTIVGTYRVPDRADAYWAGNGNEYFPPQAGRAFAQRDEPPSYDALLTTATTFDLARPLDLDSVGSTTVALTVDRDALHGDDAGRLLAVIRKLRLTTADQRVRGISSFDRLDTDIEQVVSEARVAQAAFAAPALLVTLQIVALTWILLFLAVTSVVEARTTEIALARLRGLSPWAVRRFALGEVVLLIVVSVPVGMVAGLAAGRLLAGELGADIPTELGPRSALAAGSAALGGIAAAIVAAHRTVSRPVAEQWQPTPPRPRRRSGVVDLLLLAVATVGFAELATGGLLGRNSRHSTLTLLAPGLLCLASAIVTARLIPLAAGTMFTATRRHGGVGGFLATRRIARGTGTATTLIVLVISLGLVTFAIAAWSAAKANHREVALTHLGVDTALTVLPPNAHTLSEVVDRIDPDGKEAVAVVTHQNAAGGEATLVGVDPQRFANVAYWRSDFATASLTDLLASITRPTPPQVMLRGTGLRVTLQLRESPVGLYYQPFAELESPGSTALHRIPLGELRPGPPVVGQAPIPDCDTGCELRGFSVEVAGQEPGTDPALARVEVAVTHLAVRQPEGWTAVDAGLREPGRWRTVGQPGSAQVRPSPTGLLLRFLPTQNLQAIPNTFPEPIPAITTGRTQPDPFGAPVTGLDGKTLTILPITRARGLPGVTGVGVLVDAELAQRAAIGISENTEYQVWCAPGAASRMKAELTGAGIPVTAERTAADLARHFDTEGPGLALRLLLAAAAAAGLLAAAATAIDLYASSRRRTYELAALRAVGVSHTALRTALLIEHAATLATAAVVGPVAGLVASSLTLSKVPTFSVPPTTPPLRYPLDISTISITAGLALAIATVTAAAMTAAIQRRTRADQLREAPI